MYTSSILILYCTIRIKEHDNSEIYHIGTVVEDIKLDNYKLDNFGFNNSKLKNFELDSPESKSIKEFKFGNSESESIESSKFDNLKLEGIRDLIFKDLELKGIENFKVGNFEVEGSKLEDSNFELEKLNSNSSKNSFELTIVLDYTTNIKEIINISNSETVENKINILLFKMKNGELLLLNSLYLKK
ncbi:12975_t:CDS:2 [Dentiscutata heterogama]|uniref:12975_t:CDS:1 n=1 Tax=Dentiscutata heterogama TaxID=1316150 RepID=A0ACA9LAT0_9GLOM|nr:12975_t:CDS:2 [Dentiscutata heterogama]